MQERSVYSLGAADGLWTGLAMGFCMMFMILSTRIPFLGLVAMALVILTPWLVWRFLRRAWISGQTPPTFSAVWLHGICIFLFGSIIMALMMYISLKFLSPGWIENQTLLVVKELSANPNTLDQAKTMSRIIESGQLPSPIYVSISSIWLVAFTGSMWSMIFAAILTGTKHFKNLRNHFQSNVHSNG